MDRHRLLVLAFAGLMALLGGCAGMRERMGGGGQGEPVVESPDSLREPSVRERSRSAEKPPEPEATGRSPAIAADSAAETADPATRMLIDTELRDLPAAERQAWRSYLASVAPERVPELLQARRTNPELAPGEPFSDRSAGSTAKFDKPINPSPGSIRNINADDTEPDASRIETALSLQESLPDEAPNPSSEVAVVTPAGDPEVTAPGKSALDAMRIWPQGLRGDRSLSERLAGTRLPLPAPWHRHEAEKATAAAPAPVAPAEPSSPSPPVVELPRANPKAAYWEDELQKLISVMEAEVARTAADTLVDRQEHIQRQVYLRMLYLMAGEPEKAQFPIAGAEPAYEEFWTSVFWGMSNYFDETYAESPVVQATQTVTPFREAIRHLEPFQDLELKGVAFCRRIDGWGQYETFEQDEFDPGQPVLLYAEIRNFQSEATPEGRYLTRVASQIEIVRLGPERLVVDREELGETEDLCRTRRTDYYSGYRIELPTNLPPGAYELRLSVQDLLSERAAVQTVGFRIR